MFTHIQTFFTSLLGVTLPQVVYIIFARALAYLILRMFLKTFNVDVKILDYTFYCAIAFILAYEFWGYLWELSFA